jgi:hypothetical protein
MIAKRMSTFTARRRLILLLGLTCSVGAARVMAEETPLTAQEREMYRAIAHRVFDKLVVAAHNQYPDLAALASNNVAAHEEAKDKLWVAYHYSHGLSWIPNPDYKPGVKAAQKLKSFAADGIDLNLYFYEGDWMGQATVLPFVIGKMKVVTFIEGSKATTARFGQALRDAIEAEKSAFQEVHGAP